VYQELNMRTVIRILTVFVVCGIIAGCNKTPGKVYQAIPGEQKPAGGQKGIYETEIIDVDAMYDMKEPVSASAAPAPVAAPAPAAAAPTPTAPASVTPSAPTPTPAAAPIATPAPVKPAPASAPAPAVATAKAPAEKTPAVPAKESSDKKADKVKPADVKKMKEKLQKEVGVISPEMLKKLQELAASGKIDPADMAKVMQIQAKIKSGQTPSDADFKYIGELKKKYKL